MLLLGVPADQRAVRSLKEQAQEVKQVGRPLGGRENEDEGLTVDTWGHLKAHRNMKHEKTVFFSEFFAPK